MDKRILAICDQEENYAYRMMEYLNEKENMPFDIHVYTDVGILTDSPQLRQIECLMIAESTYTPQVEELEIPHILILNETGNAIGDNRYNISKYQSTDCIFRDVMSYYSEKSILLPPKLRATGERMRIIGIYTPINRCLQTTFSLTLGQMLARKHKTLYMNFEHYSGMNALLGKHFQADLTDVVYYMECAREKMAYKLENIVETVNGLDFVPPVEMYPSLQGIRGEQWTMLLNEMEQFSEYEYLLLDLSDCVNGVFDILRACDKVYTITRNDSIALAKMEQYETMLKTLEYEDVTAKTKKWKFPVFQQLPARLENFTIGEMAEYIKQNVLKDVYEL